MKSLLISGNTLVEWNTEEILTTEKKATKDMYEDLMVSHKELVQERIDYYNRFQLINR
jgi:hypothetical protein